jgi:hypothetical protein
LRLGALVVATKIALAFPQAQAANIITFGVNANTCGGAVMVATAGAITVRFRTVWVHAVTIQQEQTKGGKQK